MPIITLPDGSKKVFEKSVTILEIAQSIGAGLAKATIAGKVNDVLLDATIPINKDSNVVIITSKDKEGIEIIRHSFAHLIGHAVKQIYSDIKMAIGPVIEDGFYYDIFSEYRFTPEDLIKIENRINKLIKTNYDVEILQVSKEEAIKTFKERDETFKLRIIEEIPEEGLINLYKHEEYIDMCRGPHVPNTRHLRHFKLLKLSGSYWRGNSENESLQRIYGTAWAKEKELNDYLTRIEEAEKRDHRKLGKKHSLFHIQEESPGMIFWHPNGWTIYQVMEKYIREILKKNDYLEIKTPQAVDKSLWEKSGHWEKFRDDMFTTASENRTYAIKPMNCPCHIQVFNQGLKSYKDLPIRLAEFGSCHRNEPSGALHGLMRVRNFTQDDAHIFCTEEQIQEEVSTFIDLVFEVYKTFGFDEIIIKLSTRPEKRVGSEDIWDKSEEALTKALDNKNLKWELQPGEGAFYGPKIEFSLKDCLNRVWQCGTIQVDFSMPIRLNATYVDIDNEKRNPVMLHRAILGSFERFIGILIEQYEAKFPIWLAPYQIILLSITDRNIEKCLEFNEFINNNGYRSKVDVRNEKIGYKIREATLGRVPLIAVIGDKEEEIDSVALRALNGKNLGVFNLPNLFKLMDEQIEKKGRTE
ncbi:threonine--tRNA ligase [Prochlorococcus marinus str. XMU1401]|uniref:Threonine--tRNA ligase n=1 Tax=Prochlorococcus marinus str. XMU1401 TaxID=2052594 RepID=A0A8I1X1D8_PROMR|nr:threonine--tRNA ligase [Prochlorococcus marinus]MBO8222489.1 threonine--tRNA ligase [Prochlorococcus marinus str. XMU1401]MBW3060863.1 threonine--tRNA ligase [Prochlorococcus marinus str. XMU1401E]MCQ9197868.1 threonine--tRNA ligase [Prochlorococcus marinus XMU1429]PJC84262.1 threonine--tRNA ligase [Prochlorococcus marinus str. XMU1401]